MKKLTYFLTLLSLFLTTIQPALADSDLIKTKNSNTIYYLDGRNVRHPFPNLITYQSWYGQNKNNITTITDELLEKYTLGKNITIRPGSYLIKAQTSPQVYAVQQGGIIRPIRDEMVAQEIFEKDWNKRIVDVPDVFFSNYTLGEAIDNDNDVPDNSLYYDTNKKVYYYKEFDIVRPFANQEAISKNGYNINQAIKLPYSYYVREKPIATEDKNIFNPAALPANSKIDCENKKLKAAFVVVAQKETTAQELAAIEKIKSLVADRFAWATDSLATIDLNYPTNVIYDNGYILTKEADGTTDIKNELINTFYENNPDNFDYVFIWTNFKTPEENTNEIANFTSVTNVLEGIGRYQMKASGVYGSTGKLKGVILMGNINKYEISTEKGMNFVLDTVLHEIGHQTSAYIGFNDGKNDYNLDLLRPDKSHWSYYAGFISPLGGSGWIDNGDGTFTSALSKMSDSNLRKYSPIDLYLMGLIPYQFMSPIWYVVPKNPGELNNTITGTKKYVSIEQIIKANGKINCNLPEIQ